MCITVNHAKLAKTKILSIPVGNGNHFMAYSNSVRNTSGQPNAMILPIPGKTKKEWFYDTTKYKEFLEEIVDNSKLDEDYYGIHSKGISKGILSAERFQVGNYDVVLSNSMEDLKSYIDSIDENKKPKLNEELVNFFTKTYPNCSFAVCMFDSDKTIDAQPIALEYTPNNPYELFFPTVDSHDGKAPNLTEMVSTDHTFIYEHNGKQDGQLVKESTKLNSDVPDFLKNRKYRFFNSRSNREINGDTFMSIEDIKETPFKKTPLIKRGV